MQDKRRLTPDGICQPGQTETDESATSCECGRTIADTSVPTAQEGAATEDNAPARWPLNLATMSKRKVFTRGLIFGVGSGIITTGLTWWSSAGFPLGFLG